MITTDFLDKLLMYYNNLDFNQYKSLSSINDTFVYYFADSFNKNLYMNLNEQQNLTIIELDIKRAGPTICKNFYGNDNEFVKKLLSIEDKKQRSILISTTLNEDDLKCINIVCKMIILGLVIEINRLIKYFCKNDILILELKKDGIIFSSDKIVLNILDNLKEYSKDSDFINYIIKKEFKFHYDIYNYYCRYERTTILITESVEIIRKGLLKYCPPAIQQISKQLFETGEYDKSIIKSYCDSKFMYIICKANCNKLLQKYILCETNRVLCNDLLYRVFTPSVIQYIDGVTYLTHLFSPLVKLYFNL